MKTILAPGLKARLLGLHGWYSTNILGNRDGEVLDDPGSFQDQRGVEALGSRIHPPAAGIPRLYSDFSHLVRSIITAAWRQQGGVDNIDIFGWLGYQMQIKIDFLCRDSILAAPIVLDLACLWIWRSASGCVGFKSGCRSISKARWLRRSP